MPLNATRRCTGEARPGYGGGSKRAGIDGPAACPGGQPACWRLPRAWRRAPARPPSPPALSGQAGGPAAPGVEKVATGPARSLGEPAAAQDAAATAVAATSFGAAGAQAAVWTRRAGATTWRRAGSVLPAGFGSSYDPAAAAAPGGPLLVVAGTAPPGEQCITSGSVAIASVGSRGTLGAARLVSDQRGTGSFDDRPMVAAGSTAWSGWRGHRDRTRTPARTSVTATGSRSPSPATRAGPSAPRSPCPPTAATPRSACGSRRCPAGRWRSPGPRRPRTGDQAVLVSVLGADGRPRQPERGADRRRAAAGPAGRQLLRLPRRGHRRAPRREAHGRRAFWHRAGA